MLTWVYYFEVTSLLRMSGSCSFILMSSMKLVLACLQHRDKVRSKFICHWFHNDFRMNDEPFVKHLHPGSQSLLSCPRVAHSHSHEPQDRALKVCKKMHDEDFDTWLKFRKKIDLQAIKVGVLRLCTSIVEHDGHLVTKPTPLQFSFFIPGLVQLENHRHEDVVRCTVELRLLLLMRKHSSWLFRKI